MQYMKLLNIYYIIIVNNIAKFFNLKYIVKRLPALNLFIIVLFSSCDYFSTQSQSEIFEWKYSTPSEQDLDPRKHEITIKHLLTMQAGIDHEHNNYSRLYSTSNWIQSAIEEALSYNPGERHSYNTFLTHLLSGIITKTAATSTYDFGQEHLFDPLRITIQDWKQSPQGIYFGGNNMFFTTRDIAILGYLYLNDGEINGVQIGLLLIIFLSIYNILFVNYQLIIYKRNRINEY